MSCRVVSYPVSVKTRHMRWWAGIVFFVALSPIFCLYFIWLPLTCWGWIEAADIPPNKMSIPLSDSTSHDSSSTVLSTPGKEKPVAEIII